MREYQLVTDKFACLVLLNEESLVIHTAPILRRFESQPLRNLLRWARKEFTEVKFIDLENNQVVYEKLRGDIT